MSDYDRETGKVCRCGLPLTRWQIVNRVKLWYWCLRCDGPHT